VIVITTPTGNIGHQVLDLVLAAGQPARVIVRDPAKLPAEIHDQVEVVPGTHGDPRVVERAFAGADALFWLLPADRRATSPAEAFVDFTRPAAEAIREQGVKRVVSVSSLGRGTDVVDRAGHITASLAMDDLIAGTGVAFRALAMPAYMDNLLRQTQAIKEQGSFFDITSPDRERPTVATRDIAAIAAGLLLDNTWSGQEEVPALGPEDLSNNDMAAIVSEVLGTVVRYQRISRQAWRDRASGLDISEGMAKSLLDMMVAVDDGLYDGVVRTPRHAIDTPTTFRQWCEDTLKPAIQTA